MAESFLEQFMFDTMSKEGLNAMSSGTIRTSWLPQYRNSIKSDAAARFLVGSLHLPANAKASAIKGNIRTQDRSILAFKFIKDIVALDLICILDVPQTILLVATT